MYSLLLQAAVKYSLLLQAAVKYSLLLLAAVKYSLLLCLDCVFLYFHFTVKIVNIGYELFMC